MKTGKIVLSATALLLFGLRIALGQNWQMQPVQLQTRWAKEVSPNNSLKEYPRPQLTRPDWINLNGLWDYAITPDLTNNVPSFAGKILVPFPIESALSGVMA